MYPTQVPINEDNIKKLTSILRIAYKEILGEIKDATSFGAANRRAILKQIEQILTESGVKIQSYVEEELPIYYKVGMNDAEKQLRDNGIALDTTRSFNKIHTQAITALVDDTARAFGESLTGVNRSANLILGKAVRDEITQKMAVGKIGGKALKEIKNNVVGILENQGLSALVDKGGRKWELDTYSEMLIRTKTVEARNRGLANRMVENGYDLVEVSSHGATDVCGDWEGKILSLTGQTPGYKTVADAESAGLFHPNCKHAINVLVPELASKTRAYDD